MVSWGGWEYSGGNGMRVGLEVSVQQSIGHNAPDCWVNVEYWTENQYTYGDDQSLNLGGAIGGSIGYRNGQGGAPVKRGERVLDYNYGPNEYKTDAQRSFSATVNGAFNGVTPSKTVTVNIPDRPYAAPASPSSQSVVRVSDETNQVRWNNRPTAGEPYSGVRVERYIYGYGGYGGVGWTRVATLGASTEAYNDASATPNRKYTYRIEAYNGVGDSGYTPNTNILYTTPATPSGCTRTQLTSTTQKIDWVSNVNYAEHQTQVFACIDGVWGTTPIYTAGAADGAQSYTHTVDPTKKYKYRVRAKTSTGTALYSSYSGETTESSGTTTPPNPPTNLAPTGGLTMDGQEPIVLSWKHNATDGKGQVKYEVQHREVGSGTWVSTGEKTATTASYTLAPTYGYSKSVEWQVRTWGTDAAPSDWSATATFLTAAAVPIKYPVYLDLTSGRLEANSAMAGVNERPVASYTYASQAPSPTTGWAKMTGGNAVITKAGWYLCWGIGRYNTGTGTSARRGAALSRAAAAVAPDMNIETTITSASPTGGSITVAGMAYCNVGDQINLWRYTDVAGHYAAAAGYVEAVWIGDLIGATGTGTGGGAVKVQDEGVEKVAVASALDFVGSGVTVSDGGSGKALVTIPGGGGAAGPMQTWEAVCTVSQDYTAETPVPGCSVSVPAAASTDKFLVIGTADMSWTSGTNLGEVRLYVDGVRVGPASLLANGNAETDRHTVHQNWMVTGLSPGNHTYEFRGVSSGSWRVNASHTKFTVVKLEGTLGPIGPAGPTGPTGPMGVPAPMDAYRAIPNADLTLTTTKVAVPGCTVTLDVSGPTEKILVILAADFQWVSGATPQGMVYLTVDGVESPELKTALHESGSLSRVTAHQNWLVTGLSAGSHTIGLLANASGTGVMYLYDNQTAMTVVRLMGPKGDPGPPGAGVTDGDKGDITVSGGGANWQIDPGAVGSTEIAAGAVYPDHMAAAGTKDNTTYLRGDNSWGVPPGGQAPLAIKDENSLLTTGPTGLNFLGEGVVVSGTTEVQVTIPGPLGVGIPVSAQMDDFSSTATTALSNATFTLIGGFARVAGVVSPGFLTTDGTTFTFTRAGLYKITGSITISAGVATAGNQRRIARIQHNGVEVRRQDVSSNPASACVIEVEHTVRVAVGDTIALNGYHTNGADLALGGSPGARIQFVELVSSNAVGPREARISRVSVNIPASTTTQLDFTVQDYANGVTTDLTANSITIPAAGTWTVELYAHQDNASSATGQRTLTLLVNGAAERYDRVWPGTSVTSFMRVSITRRFNAGDVLTATAQQTSGVSLPYEQVALTVTEEIAAVSNAPANVRMYKTGDQNCPTGNTPIQCTFSAIEYSEPAGFAVVGSTYGLVIPYTGVYTVTANMIYGPHATGGTYRTAQFQVNGTTVRQSRTSAVANVGSFLVITMTRRFVAGDVIQLFGYHNAGADVAWTGLINGCCLEAARVG